MDDARTSAERRGPARPDAVLYPDIAAAGSLQRALQVELDQAGHQLTVLTGTPPGWRYVGARVEDDSRITSIVMGTQERAFVMEFWYVGVCMAHGTTEDVSGVAGATHVWQSGARVRELNEAWPFVRFDALAEAHERGEAAGYTWRRYLENSHQAPQLSRLHSFIALAIEDPRLRALMPYTSMDALGFSNVPGYPYSDGYPYVKPVGEGRYVVIGPDGRTLGSADAAGSVALVLAALPT